MADLSNQIETAAAQPKQATIDGNTFIQHSLRDQIAADRYLASKAAAKNKKRGFSLAKFKPPGTV